MLDRLVAELLARTRLDAVGPGYGGRDPAGQAQRLPADWQWWGKATANWSSVTPNRITLDPCQADGTDIAGWPNVTAYIVSPTGADPELASLRPDISLNDVMAYVPYGDNVAVVVNANWTETAGGALDGHTYTVHERYNITGNQTVIIHPGNWRGRTIFYGVLTDEAAEANADSDGGPNSLQPPPIWTVTAFGIYLCGALSGLLPSSEHLVDLNLGGGHVDIGIADTLGGDMGELFLKTTDFAGADVVQVDVSALGFRLYTAANNTDVT